MLSDISHSLNLTLDIFNMKISEKCQGFNSHINLCRAVHSVSLVLIKGGINGHNKVEKDRYNKEISIQDSGYEFEDAKGWPIYRMHRFL